MAVTLLADPIEREGFRYCRNAGAWRKAAARAQSALYKPRPVVLYGYNEFQTQWIIETLDNPGDMPVYGASLDTTFEELKELRERLQSRITVICKNGPFADWQLRGLETSYSAAFVITRPLPAKPYVPPPPVKYHRLAKPHTPVYDVEPPPTVGLLPDFVWEHLMWEDSNRHSCSPLICEECCSVLDEGLKCITCGLVYA